MRCIGLILAGPAESVQPSVDDADDMPVKLQRPLLAALPVVLGSCTIGGFVADVPEPSETAVTIRLTDDTGAMVQDATFVADDGRETTTDIGVLELRITQPTAGIIRAEGHLDEPIVVDAWTRTSDVTLWRSTASDGTRRFAVHFGGDTMMGRRYLTPTRTGTAAVVVDDGGSSARAVVADIATIFGTADLSMVNLETVVGRAPIDDAMPGKRYLLQSPPEITAALNALGVDVALLGNNHAADWGDPGIAGTIEHLDEAGISFSGAGSDDVSARIPAVVNAGDVELAVLSYTTVTGSVVNDSLPTSDQLDGVATGDGWQTEERRFEHEGQDSLISGEYIAGDVWQWFDSLDLDLAEQADVWRSVTDVYPELQDWVARRGHGGAAWFRRSAVTADVAAARSAGADVVIVQVHGGYQFADVGSSFFLDAAHTAAEAGADLVIGHHPHVLQGFEWYDDTLIAHSLGNFVFDQDFSSTFSSMMLRTVFEGDRLISATVMPVLIVDYRPVMAAGPAAEAILRELRADSTGTAPAEKIAGVVARNVDAAPGRAADIEISGNRGLVTQTLEPRSETIDLRADGTAALPGDLLVLSDSVPASVAIGRDLLRWGSFDDVTADGSGNGGAQWALDDARRTELARVDGQTQSLAIRMEPNRTSSALVRPVARAFVPRHRFMDDSGAWVDGEPDYAIRATMRRTGPATPVVRLDLYTFDDSDPLDDPESALVGRVEIPLEIESQDFDWVTVEALVPAGTFDPVDGVTPNAVMVYLQLESGTPSTVEFDDLQLVEWRRADDMPPGLWMEVDVIRSTARSVELTVR